MKQVTFAILFILLSALAPYPNDLAYIIEGEAGNCSYEAKLAIAWVYSRNDRMLGWKEPSKESIKASVLWFYYQDPTKGANHVFSDSDLALAEVKKIIGDAHHTALFSCGGSSLYFFEID